MALADTMVVMNHGRIEQVGSPHAIYNRPASEFVARFMGGHNVINGPHGKVGVRTDHVRVASHGDALPEGAQSLPAVVTDVEYQGTYVLLGLQPASAPRSAHATAEFSVMVPEEVFAAAPRAVGDAVVMHWPPQRAHPLSPASPVQAAPSAVPA